MPWTQAIDPLSRKMLKEGLKIYCALFEMTDDDVM